MACGKVYKSPEWNPLAGSSGIPQSRGKHGGRVFADQVPEMAEGYGSKKYIIAEAGR